MPPRESLASPNLGEGQPLLMSSDSTDDDDERSGDAVEEWIDHDDISQQQQPRRRRSFWQAVQERRELSDQEAARDLSREHNKCTAMAFGQAIALVAASVNMTSYTLENSFGVVAPAFQLFAMYTFLTIHLFFRSRTSPSSDDVYQVPLLCFRIHIPWYLYFLVSCIDVGAGIIMLLSLQYTSLTSVTLLGSLTVPSTMLFSKFLLSKAFYKHHILGVCLCLAGGCLTIWSDLGNPADNNNNNTTNHRTMELNVGDLLAVSAALLYGLGDAVSEYSIKHIDRMEFLGMLGLFGMVLTGLQFPFQEREVLSMLFRDPAAHQGAFVLMGSYVALLLLYYVTEAKFLVSSDATLLNLSLQAQNLWAILFSVLANHAAPPLLFYLALVLVVIGVFVYEVGGPSSDPVLHMVPSRPSDDAEQQQQQLEEDSTIESSNRQRSKGSVQYNSIQQIEII